MVNKKLDMELELCEEKEQQKAVVGIVQAWMANKNSYKFRL